MNIEQNNKLLFCSIKKTCQREKRKEKKNSINPNIQFTLELENSNGQGLPFRDTITTSLDTTQKFKWMFTGNQLTQTAISIFFQVTLCATKDPWSIHCYEGQKQSHQQTKEGEKKCNESKWNYVKTTIL